MKYDVTYSCGHTATVEIYGSTAERERKIAWMERDGLCPDCYRASQSNGLAERLGDIQLPVLTGTDKQIAYASNLRDKYVGANLNAIKSIHHLEHLSDDELAKMQDALAAKGLTYDAAMAAMYSREPKATACLYETSAGKIIDILR